MTENAESLFSYQQEDLKPTYIAIIDKDEERRTELAIDIANANNCDKIIFVGNQKMESIVKCKKVMFLRDSEEDMINSIIKIFKEKCKKLCLIQDIQNNVPVLSTEVDTIHLFNIINFNYDPYRSILISDELSKGQKEKTKITS